MTKVYLVTIKNRSAFDQVIGQEIYAENTIYGAQYMAWTKHRINYAIENGEFDYEESDFEIEVSPFTLK